MHAIGDTRNGTEWGGRNFAGDLDDLHIYNRPLSAAEVAKWYVQSLQKYPTMLKRRALWIDVGAIPPIFIKKTRREIMVGKYF